ncbi:MAG: DUF4157 domain-containing protein [Mariprofundus sp.]|nr:DUF4157 domain-containing protein [Mariprofundus sp.]
MQTAVTAEKSSTSAKRSDYSKQNSGNTFSHFNGSSTEGLSQLISSAANTSVTCFISKRSNALTVLPRPRVQTKLKVGKPNDRFEREADRMADQVLAAPAPVQSQPEIAQSGDDQPEVKKDEAVMAKGGTSGEVSPNLESQLSNTKGGGSSLPEATRSSMEQGIGADFSRVRIHTDNNAIQMSQHLNAQAFAHGSDVYFNAGKYNPESAGGKHLLAHELTHTVQQGKSPQRSKLQKQEKEELQAKRVGEHTGGTRIQGGWLSSAVSWVADKAKSAAKAVVKGAQTVAAAAMNFLELAKARAMEAVTSLPGYALIANVTGKDPISGNPLPPQQGGVLRFIFAMVGAEDYYDKIAQANIIERVTMIVKNALAIANVSWSFVWNSLKQIWKTVSINPMTWATAARMAKSLFVTLFKNAMMVGRALLTQLPAVILEGFLLLVGAPVKIIMGVLKKGANTIMSIIKKPLRFVMNLVKALKTGFFQFKDNIWKHLKDGLMGWLMGAMQGAGIQLPEKWDLSGILSIVLQVLGLTYDRIRIKLVKLLGEEKVTKLEKTFEFLKLLATGGMKALVEKAKEYISSIPGMVIDAIKSWVITKVVTAAVTKLVSFFNPAGAIIQAVLAIYNTVMFFIERAKQIASLVSAVINSVASIAAGKVGDAANWIENSMAKSIPVIISFLARLVGLGGISGKIKAVITKIQTKVDKGIDKIIAIVKKKATALFEKGQNVSTGTDMAVSSDSLTPDEKKKAAMAEFMKTVRKNKGLTESGILKLLTVLKTKYKLTNARIKGRGKDSKVELIASPPLEILLETPASVSGGGISGQKKGVSDTEALSKQYPDYIRASHADGPLPTPKQEIKNHFNSMFAGKEVSGGVTVPSLDLKNIGLKSPGGSFMRAGKVQAQSSVTRGTGRSGGGETKFGHFGADEEKINTGGNSTAYNGGHLVGDQMMDSKGSFNLYEAWNLAPQTRALNSPTYSSAIEGPVTAAINAKKEATIKYDVHVQYPGLTYQVKTSDILARLWKRESSYYRQVHQLINDDKSLDKTLTLTRRTPSHWKAIAAVIEGNVAISGGVKERKNVDYGAGGSKDVMFFLEIDKGAGNTPVPPPAVAGQKAEYKGARKVTFTATQKTF